MITQKMTSSQEMTTQKMTSSQVRKTSKKEENIEETETFPFYKSPTTSPRKDGSISGTRSIQNTDVVGVIPLADRHVGLNKEKTKVIRKGIKKEKDKENKEASKKEQTTSVKATGEIISKC